MKKRDNFSFSVINFPYLCSNIHSSLAYGVYVSQLVLGMISLSFNFISRDHLAPILIG